VREVREVEGGEVREVREVERGEVREARKVEGGEVREMRDATEARQMREARGKEEKGRELSFF
jgi:hypothetical protein